MSTGKFVDNSDKIMAMFDNLIPKRLAIAGELVRSTAFSLARVRTGRMRNSIHVQPLGWMVRIGTPVEYAIWNELGTSRMKAQPFMFPGLHQNITKIKDIILSGSRRDRGPHPSVKSGDRFRPNTRLRQTGVKSGERFRMNTRAAG